MGMLIFCKPWFCLCCSCPQWEMGFAQVFRTVWRSYEDAGPIHRKINNEISQEKIAYNSKLSRKQCEKTPGTKLIIQCSFKMKKKKKQSKRVWSHISSSTHPAATLLVWQHHLDANTQSLHLKVASNLSKTTPQMLDQGHGTSKVQ